MNARKLDVAGNTASMVMELSHMALASRRTMMSFLFRSPCHIFSTRLPAFRWSAVSQAGIVNLVSGDAHASSNISVVQGNAALLEKLRARQVKDTARAAGGAPPVKEKPAVPQPAPPPETFEELGLNEELMQALDGLKIKTPTEVQCIGIPSVLAGEDVVIASHTGSGKTLTYMLPVVQVCTWC